MRINDLLPNGDELPNLRDMMRRIVEYNDKQTEQSEWVAPVFNCFIAPDGALKFEALVMTADVRRELTMLLEIHVDELHEFSETLCGKE